MVVSTIYDNDLKQKVFQVRDSERYTNSTITLLEVDTHNNNRSYLALDLIPEVQRNLGVSSIAFYDGDSYLGVVPCRQNKTPSSLTVKVPYGYHKLWAKYLGNAECLSSKSNIVEIDITEPDLALSYFNLTSAADYYFRDALANQISGYLKLTESGTALANKTVAVYMDNEWISTVTTGSNGSFSFLISDLSIGNHVISFVFDGDDATSGCEIEHSFEFLKSQYILEVSTPRQKVAVGETLSFYAQLSYYDGEELPNTNIYLSELGSSTVYDSKVTDSEGKATLSTVVQTSGTHYYEVYVDSITEEVPIVAVNISDISIVADTITGVNQILPISATVYAGNDAASGVTVTVDGTQYKTNTNGQISINYEGQGIGTKTMTFACGSIERTLTIEDTLMYYSKSQNKEYGLQYTVENALSVLRKIKGLELAASNIEGKFYLYGGTIPVSWDLEFKVISITKTSTPSGDFKACNTVIPYSVLRENPTIRVVKRDTSIKVYYNDTQISSTTTNIIFPMLTVGFGNTILIDDIKWLAVNL